jgi:sugar phosphate isomerase/epimerase
MNNPVWIMSSAFPGQPLERVIQVTKEVGAQGMELLVFRRETDRQDHVATHLDYERFGPDDARRILDRLNRDGLRFSIGSYDNLIGGDPAERVRNQNHILRLVRMAHLLGGDANDVTVGTFVGYNHERGAGPGGFARNLEEYVRVFAPIVKYAEGLGVTLTYENCPMEGWRPAATPTTYNNLPATLAARKLMYTLIPSRAHGETYDPSHDVWQHTDPVEAVRASDLSRIRRIHVKSTRLKRTAARTHWGGLYPMQMVDAALAKKAGVPVPAHDWDRHHYEQTLPGFGGGDDMDWRAFVEVLTELGYAGPFVLENEADNSAHTGNRGATVQGFRAAVLNLAPVLWPLVQDAGYRYDSADRGPLAIPKAKDVPVVTMDVLTGKGKAGGKGKRGGEGKSKIRKLKSKGKPKRKIRKGR